MNCCSSKQEARWWMESTLSPRSRVQDKTGGNGSQGSCLGTRARILRTLAGRAAGLGLAAGHSSRAQGDHRESGGLQEAGWMACLHPSNSLYSCA